MPEKQEYTGKQIKVLEGLEGVRMRPSMYVGSTGKDGLHHLVYEVVDNSVDEALGGYCKIIKVTINKNGSVTVEDDGRGIPVDAHPVYKVPAIEIALTKLHAGGKFDKKSYLISGGLHGVGVSVVNALSKKLVVEVKRDGKLYRQEYSRGKPTTKLQVGGKATGTGTTVTFWPDNEIFSVLEFDYKVLETRFREISFLNPGLKITLFDEEKNKTEEFFSEGGLIEFVKWMNKSKDVLHVKPIYFKRQEKDTILEVAIQYNEGYQENIFGFVNTINTVEGGTHVSGFKTALTRVINDYAKKTGMLKNENLTGDDVREGLTAIISIKIPNPQFEGQTKTKLGNSDIKGMVDSAVTSSLTEFFEENPAIAKKISLKSLDSAKARLAAKKAKDLIRRKNAFSLGGLPGKLTDCSARKSEDTELYIVEGESAGGCFSGATKIALTDGRNISFKELVKEHKEGKENFCYTINKDGNIGIAKIENPRITNRDTEVLKIILDNNEEIICTPNHEFMLRNGEYREAKNLTPEDSLMPLVKKLSNISGNITIEGYEMVLAPNGKWIFTHLLSDDYNLKNRVYLKEQGEHKHHIDFNNMLEAVKNYNHKIKQIIKLKEKIDVYDLEVLETHNFALASGIFVHNSAKNARDKEHQAILPIQGKILNVEKSSPSRALSSEEIANMITAIGTGVGEQFDIKNLRYNKIIIMSVDGQETSFVQTPTNQIKYVKIGDFIDGLLKDETNPSIYKVLCFNLKNRKTQFKPIKAVIKHPIEEDLYEIKTSYGRNVRVTSSHSVFVSENNNIKLKKGNEIKKGDKILAPKSLPLHNYSYPLKIDLLALLIKYKDFIKEEIYVRGNSVQELIKSKIREIHKDNENLVDKRVVIPKKLRNKIKKRREEKKLSQDFICNSLKLKQPCIYYDWEKGKHNPTLNKFGEYLDILEIDKNQAMSQVQVISSSLDRIWEKDYKNSGRNKVKDYINLSEIEFDDLQYLNDVLICPTHYKNKGINRFVNLNESLLKLIGFWVAEGSYSLRNGIRISIGNNDIYLVDELNNAFKELFGISGKLCYFKDRNSCSELKLVNRIASLFWKFILELDISSSNNKKIPSLVFNVNKELQLEFLRTYFLGDGTISKSGISFTTISKDLANQLVYLLQSFGVIAGTSTRKPGSNDKISSKQRVFTIAISNKEDLLKLKKIWQDHRNSHYLIDKLKNNFPSINRKFEIISDDLISLEVKDVNKVKCSSGNVYDFSIEDDENFIAGFGGLCCHNTDADVDGEHIKTLLLTFFFRFMPQLIENGKVFVAMPPLFRIRKNKDYYVYSEEELKKAVEKLGNANITRFKGLGEMSLEQLWDTTMNPKTRKIKKIFIEDAIEADKVFTMLMGSDVSARKQFISENAKEAKLDI